MKTIIIVLLTMVFCLNVYAEEYPAARKMPQVHQSNLNLSEYANKTLLPSPYKVYTNGKLVINHPFRGFEEKSIPTDNSYKDAPGCYVVCYSHNKKDSVYSTGGDIFVMGQIRVAGSYQQRICVPQGFEGQDISAADKFKQMCNNQFKACNGGCWAGGDSGGWYGLQ